MVCGQLVEGDVFAVQPVVEIADHRNVPLVSVQLEKKPRKPRERRVHVVPPRWLDDGLKIFIFEKPVEVFVYTAMTSTQSRCREVFPPFEVPKLLKMNSRHIAQNESLRVQIPMEADDIRSAPTSGVGGEKRLRGFRQGSPGLHERR